MKPGIEFKNITKAYASNGPLAVKGIDFTVPKGTLTTLLGPSGCGKTTTLRMIAGLESPTGGQIWIDGADVTTMSAADRHVSLVFQSYALFPHMTIFHNVAYGLAVAGVGRASMEQRVDAALATVGLSGYGKRWPGELSGGQQQRVALARALVLEPAVLLFDEPLSNLDARLRRQMRDEIRALQQRLRLTVAYVTHDQSEALAVSDQIIVMRDGRIAQAGTPADLYERPNSEFVAGFMGEALLLPAQVTAAGDVRLGPLQWRPPLSLRAGPVQVAVRPEAWRVGDPGEFGMEARVLKSTYLGGFYEYTLDSEIGELFVVCPHIDRQRHPLEAVSLGMHGRGVSIVVG
ncbi:ABC transporter ATP-binding protein [Pseudoduganella namucuonensis]|uniref:Iron(III) transport system ATP-binding protein n=1 Tax=Pseudoduganella namucuonensis TaxID=1035707 RepID=A0A1I7LVS3_9BURK|nr:ABC transporter ATP-binding protein [Pseudoduganella namucuonensis]SFV13803.1 iron(III) transport system ATP-binding protein [Pseudoduganella namucuonensis]